VEGDNDKNCLSEDEDDADWQTISGDDDENEENNLAGDGLNSDNEISSNPKNGDDEETNEAAYMTPIYSDTSSERYTAAEADSDATALPTRLIDVLYPASDRVRLYLSGGTTGTYVALSYCWGSTPELNPLRTLKSNISSFVESIPVSNLPKTIRDAIHVTRELGIQYLWVDSICIIQDDELDWKQESQNMGQIFENAICTIAATGAEHSEQGLFLNSATSHGVCLADKRQAIKVPIRLSETAVGEIWLGDLASGPSGFDEETTRSRWFSRGWVVQERILSRRIVHFAKSQLFWECQEEIFQQSSSSSVPLRKGSLSKPSIFGGFVTEETVYPVSGTPSFEKRLRWISFDSEVQYTSGVGLPPGIPPPPGILFPPGIPPPPGIPLPPGTTDGFTVALPRIKSFWPIIVESYNHCQLTIETDKLIAFEGLARAISSLTGETYFRGIWLEDVSRSLSWMIKGSSSLAFQSEESRKLAGGEDKGPMPFAC
jgi:hypothetical protein